VHKAIRDDEGNEVLVPVEPTTVEKVTKIYNLGKDFHRTFYKLEVSTPLKTFMLSYTSKDSRDRAFNDILTEFQKGSK